MPSFHQDCSCKDRKEHDMMQKELELENKELITSKVLIALLAVIIGIYLVKRSNKINITSV